MNIIDANNQFSGLRAGIYSVNIRDQAGCRKIKNIKLTNPPSSIGVMLILFSFCYETADEGIVVKGVMDDQPPSYTYWLGLQAVLVRTRAFLT